MQTQFTHILEALRTWVSLVVLADNRLGNSDYAYWLIEASPSLHGEVLQLRDWIIRQAQPDPDG